MIPNEIRVALAGHIQRGGNPCGYDRFMATRFGVYGANLLLNKDFGKLVVFDKNEIKAIPLSETAGKLKFVLPTKVGEVMQTTDVSKDEKNGDYIWRINTV